MDEEGRCRGVEERDGGRDCDVKRTWRGRAPGVREGIELKEDRADV